MEIASSCASDQALLPLLPCDEIKNRVSVEWCFEVLLRLDDLQHYSLQLGDIAFLLASMVRKRQMPVNSTSA